MNTKFLPISVVVTVKNDEAGIARLMEALAGQTVKPDEVVVVRADGGKVQEGTRKYKKVQKEIKIRTILAVGCSRGKGRNIGVKMARNEVIAVTDAGCRPHPDWLEKLIGCLETDKSYKDYKDYKEGERGEGDQKDRKEKGKTVVAGWYRAEARTQLQQIMAYFLVPAIEKEEKDQKDKKEKGKTQKDKRGEGNIPASRSIMFTKKAWEMVGGYPEEAVSGAEDLEFARRLARHPEVEMIYCPEAVVDWEPPATLGEFFRDIVKHTRGNVEVGYWPHLWRNLTVVLRWMAIGIWPWLGVAYLVWVIGKGIIVIKVIKIINIAQIIIVQLAADGGVIWGLGLGAIAKIANVECIKVRPCRGKVGPWEPEGGRQNRL